MGIFSKKYDYENERLQYKYDLETDEIYFARKGERVSREQLNLRSRRVLKKKNRMTEEERKKQRLLAEHEKKQIEEFKKRNAAIEERNSNGWPTLQYDSFEVLDGKGFETRYSPEVKEYLEELTSEENNAEYLVGIHRMDSSKANLDKIFEQGIVILGHEGGAAKGTPELKNTVGYYPSNKIIMKEVACADQYKSSTGSIVVKIPKEDIVANNIYVTDEEGKDMYLNPKYIMGYFPIEDDKTVSQIVTKDTLNEYKERRIKEAQEYINMGDKSVSYPPPEME